LLSVFGSSQPKHLRLHLSHYPFSNIWYFLAHCFPKLINNTANVCCEKVSCGA